MIYSFSQTSTYVTALKISSSELQTYFQSFCIFIENCKLRMKNKKKWIFEKIKMINKSQFVIFFVS